MGSGIIHILECQGTGGDILERVVTQNAPILLLVLLIDQINHHFHHHVLLFCLAFSNHQS